MFIFYNGLLMLTGNDPGAQSDDLIWTGTLFIICGALMNANVFGTICSIF